MMAAKQHGQVTEHRRDCNTMQRAKPDSPGSDCSPPTQRHVMCNHPSPTPPPTHTPCAHKIGTVHLDRKRSQPRGGGGDSSGLDAKYPPLTVGQRSPGGGGGVLGGAMGGGVGVWEGQLGGGGGPGGAFGGGGGGGACPQGQALVNHRLPLPPLAFPLIIPSP